MRVPGDRRRANGRGAGSECSDALTTRARAAGELSCHRYIAGASTLLALLSPGVLAACVRSVELALPELQQSPKAGTVLVALIRADRQAPFFYAERVGAGLAVQLVAREGDQPVVIQLRESLEALQLERGDHPFDPQLPPERALPEPILVRRLEGGAWSEDSTLPEPLRGSILPALDLGRCAADGGCFEGASPLLCKLPCDPPAPDPELAEPRSPAAPRLPNFVCPPGWSRAAREEEAVMICEPPVLARTASCTGDMAQMIGDGDCRRIGPDCGAGPFASELPLGGQTLYVDPLATPPGEGTILAPYPSIAAALEFAGEGAVIALARGRYDESPRIERSVTIAGACARETVISPVAPGGELAMLIRGGVVRVQNLSFDGPGTSVRVEGPGTSAALQNVVIDNHAGNGPGVQAISAAMSLEDVVIRDRLHPAITGYCGSDVRLSRVLVEGTFGQGINVTGFVGACEHAPSRLIAEDTIVRAGRRLPDSPDAPYGICASYGTSLQLRRALIERAEALSLCVREASTATIADVIVRDPRPERDRGHAFAIVVEKSAADLRRVIVEGSVELGVVFSSASTATIADSLVLDTRQLGRFNGVAIAASNTAALRVERVYAARMYRNGVVVDGCSRAAIEDFTARDVFSDDGGEHNGDGVLLANGTVGALRRVRVANAFGAGVAVHWLNDPDVPCPRAVAEAVLEDIDVEGAASSDREDYPRGFSFSFAKVSGARLRYLDGAGRGVDIAGSSLRLEDVTLGRIGGESIVEAAGVYAQPFGPERFPVELELRRAKIFAIDGHGVTLIGPSPTATIAASSIEATRETGLGCYERANVRLEHARIEGVMGSSIAVYDECRMSASRVEVEQSRQCPGAPACAGLGAEITDRGQLVLERFSISGSSVAGVRVQQAGEVRLIDGRVASNPVAVQIGRPELTIGELIENVLFTGNRELVQRQ